MDPTRLRQGREVIELVAAIGDHPFGYGFFNVIHEGLSHHVETEEEAKQGE